MARCVVHDGHYTDYRWLPRSPTLERARSGFYYALIGWGVGIVFYTAVAVVEKAVEGEFQQFFGRRRMQKRIEALTDITSCAGSGGSGKWSAVS